jgi:hypothetical protein
MLQLIDCQLDRSFIIKTGHEFYEFSRMLFVKIRKIRVPF